MGTSMERMAQPAAIKERLEGSRLVSEYILKRLVILELLIAFALTAVIGTMAYLLFRDPENLWELISNRTVITTALRTLKVCVPLAIVVALVAYTIAFFWHVYTPRSIPLALSTLMSLYVVSYYFLLVGWRTVWAENGLLRTLPGLAKISPALGYGPAAMLSVMTIRYLPIAILLTYLRIATLPVTKIHVAKNLGLSPWKIHLHLYLPWSFPALGLVSLFTAIFASLDNLASSLAGGGRIQILGNLIVDWQRTHLLYGMAMGLGLAYVALLGGFIFFTLRFLSTTESSNVKDMSATEGVETGGVEYWGLLIVTLVFVCLELSPLVGMIFLAIGWNKSYFPSLEAVTHLVFDEELRNATFLGLGAAFASAVIGTGLATLSVLARHIRESTPTVSPPAPVTPTETLILTPLVVPPLLAGIAGNAFQGQVLMFYGSIYSIILAHIVMFAPLAYFIIMSGLQNLSQNSYTVAKNLGITLGTYVTRIFFPACRFSTLIGFLLVFAFSLNEAVLARYVGGTARPLAVFLADKQITALETHHFVAISLMFGITAIILRIASSGILKKEGPGTRDG